jgi:hypothetical protein
LPALGFVPLLTPLAGTVVLEIIVAVPFAMLGRAVAEEQGVIVTVEVMVFGGVEMVDVIFWPEMSWVIVLVVLGCVRTIMITWTEEDEDEELEELEEDEEEEEPLVVLLDEELVELEVEPEVLPSDELGLELELLDPKPGSILTAGGGGAA